MAHETETLAGYVANLKFEDIPPQVLERAKVLTLDFLGSAIRARRDAESTPSLLKMLEALSLDGKGDPPYSATARPGPRQSRRCSTVRSAIRLISTTPMRIPRCIRAHRWCRPRSRSAKWSAPPAATCSPRSSPAMKYAAGSATRSIRPRIMRAAFTRPRPPAPMARPPRPQSCSGCRKQQIIAAFGVSGSQAAGSLQFLVNGAWNKRYQVGAAAMNGVIAATLARNDFVGSSESVEGKHGLLVGYSDNAHPEKAVAGLGKIYETMKIGVKPYPSCRYTHAALDAIIAMRREHNLTPDQIKRVEIGLHRNGITLTGDAATKRHPTSIVGGQFSMFFTGAVALDQGRFGWDDYDKARRCRGRCARRQVRRGAGRPARSRPHPSRSAPASRSPPTTACMSGSMPIPPASPARSRTRRRCSRNF